VEKSIEELAAAVVNTAFHLHQDVGPGLLESVYETVLASRLEKQGLRIERQHPIPVLIDGISFNDGFRADIFVEQRLLVEIKSVERLSNIHFKQALTYVRLSNLPLGLLINFGGMMFKDNIKRIMNDRNL
jgi:GxxExxY protein